MRLGGFYAGRSEKARQSYWPDMRFRSPAHQASNTTFLNAIKRAHYRTHVLFEPPTPIKTF